MFCFMQDTNRDSGWRLVSERTGFTRRTRVPAGWSRTTEGRDARRNAGPIRQRTGSCVNKPQNHNLRPKGYIYQIPNYSTELRTRSCILSCLFQYYYPAPGRGTGYCFRAICFFVCLFVCLFLCFFVSNITRKRLDRFAWNFQGRCGVNMERPD